MKPSRFSLMLLCAICFSTPAMADVFGLWRVQGSISGRPFVDDCHFVPAGAGFGGACIGAKDGNPKFVGKVNTLTQGTVAGNQVTWGFPVPYMFMSFQVTYRAVLTGNQMTGTISAGGRQGKFTASRE
jgi:hypothetical protein